MPGNAPRQQAGQSQVHIAPGERVKEKVPAIARVQRLGQQGARRGQCRPACLHVEQGFEQLHLGSVKVTGCGSVQTYDKRLRQLIGQRHAPATPARHGRFFPDAWAHVGCHLMHAHQLQQAACKQQVVARFQPGNKAFFHRAQRLAATAPAEKLHRHAGVAHDGADAHAVAPRQLRIGHMPHALRVRDGAPVVGVGAERAAAMLHKRQRPLPLVIIEVAVGEGGFHFRQQRVCGEAAAQRHGDQMLHQHVQRFVRRQARLDAARSHRVLSGDGLQQFQAVGGHQREARGPPRCVAGAPRALHQARHAFGRANLQHPLHRQKINAQIKAGSAHNALEPPFFERQFHPLPHLAVQRAMVQRHQPGPIGPRLQQRLKPQLRLGARVGEDE